MGRVASMVVILVVFPTHIPRLSVSAIGGSETGGGVKVWTKPRPAIIAGPVIADH